MRVTPAYTYPEGSIFRTGAHNKNLFSVTRGEGVISEVNGRINESNLNVYFKAKRFHVFPDHMTQGKTQFMLTPMEIFDEAFQQTANDALDDDGAGYLMIPGTSLRWYQNYPGVFIAQISMFFSPYRPYVTKRAYRNYYDMGVRMFVDGEAIPATTRALPWSVNLMNYHEKAYSFEHRRGDLMDITWSGEVDAGWHDIHLGLFMERPRFNFNKNYSIGMRSMNADTRLHQRLYVGIRNARVMTFTNS